MQLTPNQRRRQRQQYKGGSLPSFVDYSSLDGLEVKRSSQSVSIMIQMLRSSIRASQEAMAEKAGLCEQTIYKLEARRQDARLSSIIKIASATSYRLWAINHKMQLCLMPPMTLTDAVTVFDLYRNSLDWTVDHWSFRSGVDRKTITNLRGGYTKDCQLDTLWCLLDALDWRMEIRRQ